jgi:hypothetical protein
MKIRKISILLAVSLGAIIAFPGCSKDDGAIPERVSIVAVPTITTNIDPTGSQSINLTNPASFAGKFKVDNYFPGTTNPSKVDIVVRKWNGTANNNNVKVYKAGVTTFPSNFTVTAAEIATLFGTPIKLGDTYDFAPDIYVGERKFELSLLQETVLERASMVSHFLVSLPVMLQFVLITAHFSEL